ncbi:hypothetical protein N7499_012531 [Penicillium canescens]|uniref:Maltose/galactoside acetyltransferase domain-containing protein n=1 Tax=Penicillium canescens TaxID=5083 RepID=A0AAD6N4K0_PENCN|nr:uncharacterized protein N7446_000823 [Penicillium canescens]KAJ6012867.1 hypothetical protein N7522_003222 [Penicillium canescens]KAJ6030114.1 hypothetical protein N7460_010380 [Penicillium canescens]KAJ6063851.1 hypothetical protein N7499_012531 [Penicillium canescens]KAJ6077887.1 hypothetical protein N7446_000823 [Penicillium canescens]KAJ6154655.1 hypothetical protein N7485_013024 [Penicillium canescens]
MIPKTDKDSEVMSKARNLRGVCWGEEYQRMISGMLYTPLAPDLIEGRSRARQLTGEFNASIYGDVASEKTAHQRETILKNLFGRTGHSIYIEPPLFVDYGCNISVGESFYANFHLTILDCGLVSIGNNVEIGPNVSIITGEHHTMIEERRAHRGCEFTRGVAIGDDCWIGAGVIILAGVTIGSGCSIGAGSVVKADIPPFSIAVGVPARVIRSAQQETTVE